LAIRRKVLGPEHRETAVSLADLGRLLMRRGDLAGAEPFLREGFAIDMKALGPDHANTASSKGNLALWLMYKGDVLAAEPLLRESLETRRKIFGAESFEYSVALNSLAIDLEWQGRLDEAQRMFEECVRLARPQVGDAHPRVLEYMLHLSRVRILRGDGAATESTLRDVLAARQQLYPADDWRVAQAQSLLGASLMAQKRYTEAEPLMLSADSHLKPIPGLEEHERAANRARLVALYEVLGRPSESQRYR
jgi:tetratricopeptide (TPR) repeat protein